MSNLFYDLGRKFGPNVRKVRWIWRSITGSEAEAVTVEHEVGRDLAREVRRNLKMYRSGDSGGQTGQIIDETAKRIIPCVVNKSRRFNFDVFEQAEQNAFALPGGFIFLTDSILELCEWNRDEIAFILGHEMGHVIRGHAMNRIISNLAINAASHAAPVRGMVAGWLRNVGVQFLESAYSRELESEADELGVRLVAAAGYDPSACVRLLRRLAESKSHCERFELGSYFSSHPPLNERIEDINRLLLHLDK